eukprot:CAMPEP_0196767750 /NCGR_PEP_ID=MMETSP1095-20130614/41916_1 /TAXON_ID=96789 ORGANISM="Chromulina nebulosa, Strain UTEXLB2642" /NCGR_SAMPLE_ID=MMETSP1095 /ASSEMBLY_ACC=CAM_ASM_000446 /LENGTH=504 /DNA_ID=CAMNT_0042136365 /DNA_START=1126 /DNA_END=2641 /DNA_ORIENTATION=-
MSDTLNDILSMHSIEDGEFQLILKEFCLKDVILNSVLPLKLIAEDKNIEVSVDLTYMVPKTVMGDRIRIGLVISNFLSYILKYSDNNKHILIVVSVDEEVTNHNNNKDSSGKSNVLFVFEDEGPGIPEDVLISFFQPFVQLRNDELSLGVTNGLGLALARDIIELHGGNIFITKRSNQSMRLGFSIPFEVLSKDVSAGELIKCIPRNRIISKLDIGTHLYQHNKTVTTSLNSSTRNSPISYIHRDRLNSNKPLLHYNEDYVLKSCKYEESHQNKEDGDVITVLETNIEKRKCILIVDDALSNRKILTMSLKKLDIDAESAENGLIAVDMVKDELDKYTSIFMDFTISIYNKRSNQSMRLGFSIPFEVLSKDVSAGELIKCIPRNRVIPKLDIYNYINQHNKTVTTSINSSTKNSPMSHIHDGRLNSNKPLLHNDEGYALISCKYEESHQKKEGDEDVIVTVSEANIEKRKCILIVDDALSNRKILAMSLKKLDMDAESAENGLI